MLVTYPLQERTEAEDTFQSQSMQALATRTSQWLFFSRPFGPPASP